MCMQEVKLVGIDYVEIVERTILVLIIIEIKTILENLELR